MTPQIPDRYTSDKVTYPAYIQPYIRGIRTLYQDGSFQSECSWSTDIQEVAEDLQQIFPKKVVLDGVIRQGEFHVFDVVNFKIPFRRRFDTITQILRDSSNYHSVKIVPTQRILNEQSANDQLSLWLNEGHIGMIYRIGDCLYTKAAPANPTNINPQLLLREVK